MATTRKPSNAPSSRKADPSRKSGTSPKSEAGAGRDPFALPQENARQAAQSATALFVDVNRAFMTSGERVAAVQREAADEITAELQKLAAIRDLTALPEGQLRYANALGKLTVSVAGEMFEIQRDLQQRLAEIMAEAFGAARTSTEQAVRAIQPA